MEKIQKGDMPPNIRLIDKKWVFKRKIYVQFRARLVAQGYTQIPGLEFTKNCLSVVNDITLCFMLLVWLINKWDSQTIDVETVFLHAVLEE